MTLVSSFVEIVQQLSPAMTAPTFESLVTDLTGWVFARRRNVTKMILANDAVDQKHHSVFHRVFAAAQWSLDELGLLVFGLILPWLDEVRIVVAIDDTLARKRGLKVYGVPHRSLRVVAVNAVTGGRGAQAFYSTRTEDTGKDALTRYAWRWSIEEANQNSKGHLGFEEPQG